MFLSICCALLGYELLSVRCGIYSLTHLTFLMKIVLVWPAAKAKTDMVKPVDHPGQLVVIFPFSLFIFSKYLRCLNCLSGVLFS